MKGRRRRFAAFFVVLLMGASLVPLVQSGKLNDLIPGVPHPWQEDVPPTGLDAVDDGLAKAQEILDEGAALVEDALLEDIRKEPQVPADIFREHFEDDPDHPRYPSLGGWGDWAAGGAAGTAWKTHPTAATDGSGNGYRFWNEGNGFYPKDREDVLEGYLLSPRISLPQLPPPTPDEASAQEGRLEDAEGIADAVVGNVTGRTSTPAEYRLLFDQRSNLAVKAGEVEGQSQPDPDWTVTDYAQVLVYTEEPLTSDDLDGGTPLSFDGTLQPATYITGSTDAQMEVDLTRFAGQDVWIAFRTTVQPRDPPTGIFQNPTHFDLQAGFYGWMIDNLTVEGPTFPKDLRILGPLEPRFVDGGVYRHAVEPRDPPLAVLVANHGQFTQSVEASLDISGPGSVSCQPLDGGWILRPGQLAHIRFDCPGLQAGEEYDAVFRVEGGGVLGTNRTEGIADGRPEDNSLELTFRAEVDHSMQIVPADIDPKLAGTTVNRQFTVPLRNTGIVEKDVTLHLKVLYQNASDQTIDITMDTNHVEVRSGGLDQTVTVPADPRGRDNVAHAQWGLVLRKPGTYFLEIDGTLEGGAPVTGFSSSAGVLVVDSNLFKATFDGENQTGPAIVGAGTEWDEWRSVRASGTVPPCIDAADGEVCPDHVWEMLRSHPYADKAAFRDATYRSNVLRGELEEAGAGELFERLEVRMLHQFRDLRCAPDSSNGLADCVEPIGPMGPLGVRFVWDSDAERQEAQQQGRVNPNTQQTSETLESEETAFPLKRLDYQVGGRSERGNVFAYHNDQWLDESYSLDLHDLLDVLGEDASSVTDGLDGLLEETGAGVSTGDLRDQLPTQIPAALFRDAALELTFSAPGDFACPRRGDGDTNHACPGWRVAYLEVAGVTADGDRVPLLLDNGTGEQPQAGDWFSYLAYPAAPPVNTFVVEEGVSVVDCASPVLPDPGGDPVQEAAPIAENASDTGFYLCDAWDRTTTQGLLPLDAPGAWNLFADDETAFGRPLWTNSDVNAQGRLAYEDGRTDLLLSPALRLPPGAEEPTLTIQALHRFHSLFNQGSEWKAGYEDQGTIMVRFLDDGGSGLAASTPFLPVALRYHYGAFNVEDDPLRGLGRTHYLTSQECHLGDMGEGHITPPDYATGGCSDAMADRTPARYTLDLSALPVLDYSRFGPGFEPDLTGSAYWTRPDEAALRGVDSGGDKRLLDLGRDCGGPCTVQFAFRSQTLDGTIREGPEDYESDVCKDNAHSPSFYCSPAIEFTKSSRNDALDEGWVVTAFDVRQGDRIAHDLAVRSLRIEADYDAAALGLGPGTAATVELDIINNGLFEEAGFDYAIEFWDDAGALLEADSVYASAGADTVVPPAVDGVPGEATISVPLVLPGDEGDYSIGARVGVNATPPGLPDHLTIIDKDGANDCAYLEADLVNVVEQCRFKDRPLVPIVPVRDLSVEVKVTPEAGREKFARNFDIRVENHGNVPVADSSLSFRVVPLGGSKASGVGDIERTLVVSPEPGQAASLIAEPALLDRGADGKIRPMGDTMSIQNEGKYVAIVSLTKDSPSGERLVEAIDTKVLDSFKVFYSDDFDGALRTDAAVSTGTLQATGADWRPPDAGVVDGFREEGSTAQSRAWHFGDPVNERYADDADGHLLLPGLDLSAVSFARLSFAHNYSLEGGYDGARAEVSLDGGETWQVMEPLDTTPLRPLVGDGPFVREDPGATAFTGRSMDVHPENGGWFISEYDLGAVPGLTTDAILVRFDQDGFENSQVRDLDSGQYAGMRRDPSWRVPDRTCNGDGCWSAWSQGGPEAWRVHVLDSFDGGEDETVWWFGTPDPDGDGAKNDYPSGALDRLVTPSLSLRTTSGDEATLQYWEHYDIDAGDERTIWVRAKEFTADGDEVFGDWTELTRAVSGSFASSSSCSALTNQWCKRTLDLSDYIGEEIQLGFQMATDGSNAAPYPGSSGTGSGYHWALDGVAVEVDSIAGRPALLRLRVASDGNLSSSGWTVDNIQVVGNKYSSNLAIIPDEPLEDLEAAPGLGVEWSGWVRNLGEGIEEAYIGLTAQGTTPETEDDAEALQVHFEGHDPGTGVVPLKKLLPAGSLAPDGSPNDRVRFKVNLTVPEDTNIGEGYVLRLAVLKPDGEAFRLFDDSNLGDHDRSLRLDVNIREEVTVAGPPLVQVDRPTVARGEPVRLRLPLENSGTTVADAALTFRVVRTDIDDPRFNVLAELDAGAAAGLQPGQIAVMEAEWVPDTEDAVLARVEAYAEYDFPSRTVSTDEPVARGHVLINDKPLYHQESFEEGEGGWANEFPLPSWRSTPWQWTDQEGFDGTASFHLGDEGGYGPVGADLRSPWLDRSRWTDLGTYDGSVVDTPLDPWLSFWYRLETAPNHGMVVLASPQLDSGAESLSRVRFESPDPRGYNGRVQGTPHPLDSGNAIVNPGDNAWHPALFSLRDEDRRSDQSLVGFDPMRLRFRFGAPTGGEGLSLDAVSLSAYRADVAPRDMHAVLRTGADKTFFFDVTNVGGAPDTYKASLDPASLATLGPFLKAELLDPEVSLEVGETARIGLRVYVDPDFDEEDLFDLSGGMQVSLRIASTGDPFRVALGTLHIDAFRATDLPNLEVEVNRPGGAPEDLVEGRPDAFQVTVRNTGSRGARATDMVLLACPAEAGDAGPDIKACRTAMEEGKDPADGGPFLLTDGVAAVPALPNEDSLPFDQRGRSSHSISIEWTPPVGARGDYHVLAVVDTAGEIRQSSATDDIFILPVTVLPLDLPDLAVTDLEVYGPDGEPTHRAFAGGTMRIRAVVTNVGTSDAQDVSLRILNRFLLRETTLPVMAPGQQVVLEAQWLAEPGNWMIAADATTPDREITSDNNARPWNLAVLHGRLEISVDPGDVEVTPGQPAPATFSFSNHRDAPVAVQVSTHGPDGIAVDGVPTRVELLRGETKQFPALLTTSVFMDRGVHPVTAAITDPVSGAVVARATIQVHVGDLRDVTVATDPIVTAPKTIEFEARVTNHGVAGREVRLAVDGPVDWTPTVVPAVVDLGPDGSANVTVRAAIPPGAPPGIERIRMQDGATLLAEIPVHVTASPRWTTVVESVDVSDDFVDLVVRVHNVGNAPGRPAFGGTSLQSIDPSPSLVPPGSQTLHTLRVSTAEETELQLPGGKTLDALPEAPDPPRVVLDQMEVRKAPAGETTKVHVRISNQGGRPTEVPLRLYVDGVLVDERKVGVLPGQEKELVLPWTTAPGDHVLIVSAGDPETAQAKAASVHAEPTHPVPGVEGLVSIAVLLAVALLSLRRRWRP